MKKETMHFQIIDRIRSKDQDISDIYIYIYLFMILVDIEDFYIIFNSYDDENSFQERI